MSAEQGGVPATPSALPGADHLGLMSLGKAQK